MQERQNVPGLGGGAVIALMVIGTAAVVLAVFSAGTFRFEAAALSLLAAAASFGSVATVIFRR